MKFGKKSISVCVALLMVLQSIVSITAFAADTYDYDITQNALFGATSAVTSVNSEDNGNQTGTALCDGKTTLTTRTNKWFLYANTSRTVGNLYAEFTLKEAVRVNGMKIIQKPSSTEGVVDSFYLEYYDNASDSWKYAEGSSVTGNTADEPSVNFGVVSSDKFRVQLGNYANVGQNFSFSKNVRITEMVLTPAPDAVAEPVKVPFSVTRLKPSGNDNDTYALFKDGYFVNEQPVKTSDNKTTLQGYWGCGTGTERSMVIKLDSVSDVTNLVFYAGGLYNQNTLVPDAVTIKYSSCADKSKLSNNDSFGSGVTWTTVPKESYTVSNVTNDASLTNNDYGELTGTSTKVTMGAKNEEVTAKLLDRAQQVVSFNFNEKINAGSFYIDFGTYEQTNNKAVYINEVEVYNRGTNVLLGKKISAVYPEIGTEKYQSTFGTGISDGGIALTDGKKDANWTPTAAKWTVKVTAAGNTPFVEYDLDGETIDQLVVYSGRIPYVDAANRVNSEKIVPGGSVYPDSVTLSYTEDGTTWKTVAAQRSEELLNSNRDSKLTLTSGEISPKKIRVYAGVGTIENSTNIQTPSWIGIKEIEAYNNTDVSETAKDTVDILRADADINGDAAKRTYDTYIERDNNKLLARSTRNITLSLSSPVSSDAKISVDNGATAGATTITTAADVIGQTMYFANADISGFKVGTKYTVTITDGDKVGTYSFTTSDKAPLEAQDVSGYDNFDIYLAIGQSNMSGRADIEAQDYGAADGVYLFNNRSEWEQAQVYPTDAGRFEYQGLNRYSTVKNAEWESSNGLNPLTTLAKSIKLPEGTAMGIVSNAKGNTSIEQWSKGYSGTKDYNLYEEAVARAQAAVAKGGKIKGIIWLQGCANSSKSGSANGVDTDYVTKFTQLVSDLRTDLNVADAPVIIAEIPAFAGNKSWNNMYFNKYTIPAITSSVDNTYSVYSAGSSSIGDNTHFDSASQRQLGVAIADKINDVIYGVKSSEKQVAVKSVTATVGKNAALVADNAEEAYNISDTAKMWYYTPSGDVQTAEIEMQLDGVHKLSSADIYFNNPWIYNYGYQIYAKANDADEWKMYFEKSAGARTMLKDGRINSASLNGIEACALKIVVTGKAMIDETNCKFDFSAANALENEATQALIGINEIKLYESADVIKFGTFDISAGADAAVNYDLSSLSGSPEKLMLAIAAYDQNGLAKCEIKFIDFSVDMTDKSGDVKMTLPADVSAVSAILVNADTLRPIVACINK